MAAMKRTALLLLGCVAIAGCGGGDDDDDDDDVVADAADVDGAAADAASADAPASGYDLGSYDEKGCLTFASAHPTCCREPGGGLDDCTGPGGAEPSLCAFMALCELTTIGQCQIDCEMAPTVFCITEDQVQCVIDAAVADDCVAAESSMGWVYFGD
jgi:hypothetical protein